MPDLLPFNEQQTRSALLANGVPEVFIAEALAAPRRIVAAYDEQKLAPPNLEAARRTLQILRAHVAYLDLPF